MGVGAGTGATQGVLGNTGSSSDDEHRGMADGSARVPEVLPTPELEGFIARVGPEHLTNSCVGAFYSDRQHGPIPIDIYL